MSDGQNVIGCKEPVFDIETCVGFPKLFYSAEQTGNCPACFLDGPFTSPAGKFTSTISQADADTQATTYLAYLISTRCITSAAPVVTSDSKTIGEGVSFSYQIVATQSPTSYGATGLPTGLSINTSTGLITGTPTAFGTFPVDISATNACGTGHGTLTIVVKNIVAAVFSSASTGYPGPNPIGAFYVSVDGGAYALVNTATTYTAVTQLKYKMVLGTLINADDFGFGYGVAFTPTGSSTLTSSTTTAAGVVSDPNAVSPATSFDIINNVGSQGIVSPTTATQPTTSISENITGPTSGLGNGNYMQIIYYTGVGGCTLTSFEMETILNF